MYYDIYHKGKPILRIFSTDEVGARRIIRDMQQCVLHLQVKQVG